jgi:hypothetical protein
MRLNREIRSVRQVQVTIVGCGDNASSPHHGANAYLAVHGYIGNLPAADIHRIRRMGGIFTGEAFADTPKEADIVTEHLVKEIGGSIEFKESSIIFICGHNPCAGCGSLGIDADEQKRRLVEFGNMVFGRFDVPVVVLFEEHASGNHYDVIQEFGDVKAAMRLACAA